MQVKAYFGEHDLRSIYLSAAERRTLERAAEILQRLRETLEDGREDWDEDMIVDVAMAAHTCRDVLAEDSLPIT